MRHLSIFFLLLSAFFTAPFKTLLPAAHAQGWMWGRQNTGSGVDSWPVATDPSGNVFGAGFVLSGGGPVKFGAISIPPSTDAGLQTVWVKYDPSGAVIFAGGTIMGNTWIQNIATDPSGNLILYGSFSSATMKIGSFTLTNTLTSFGSQYYIAKIDPTGTVLWAINDGMCTYYSYTGGISILGAGGVTTDAAGNIYISGSFSGATMSIGATTLTNATTGGGPNDIFVAKYTPAGVPVWANSIGGTGDDYGISIAQVSGGDVYVAGGYSSATMTVGSTTLTNPKGLDLAYIARFSPSGTPLWADQGNCKYGGSAATGLARDNTGNVYMTGGFQDTTVTFAGATLTTVYPPPDTFGKLNLFLVRYSPSGSVTWNKTISSNGSGVWGYCIGLASCGQVWVSGNYTNDAVIQTGDTLKKLVGDPIFIAGYDLSGGVVGYSGLTSGGDDQNGIACDAAGNIYTCSDYIGTLKVGKDILTPPTSEGFYMAKYASTVKPPDTAYGKKDTSVCKGDMRLYAPPGYSTYVWDDGSTFPTRTVASAGKYYVYCISCGMTTLIDTYNVSMAVTDTTYKRIDTNVCSYQNPATLKAPAGYTTYSWSTGSTASSILVSAAGTYFVSSVLGCKAAFDTFHYSITIADTTNKRIFDSVCASNIPHTLTAPTGFDSCRWSTGSSASSISINVATPGPVNYFVLNSKGCSTVVDTFLVYVKPVPAVLLGNDTSFCFGNSVTLTSPQPAGSTYAWNTGSTDDNITVAVSGTYILDVTYPFPNLCVTADTIKITVIPLPVVDLGPDLLNCQGIADSLHSSVPYTAPTYLWSDASTAAVDVVKTSGTYWLQVTDFGCKGVDTIDVKIIYDTLNFYNHDTAICRGSIVATFVTGNIDQTYQWRPTAGIAMSTTINPVILADTSATYTLTTSMPLCPDRIDSFHLDVQPNPTVYIGDNRMVCQFDSLRIIATVKPNWYTHYIYNWSPATFLDNSTTNAVTFTAGNYTQLMLTVSTPAGCAGKDSAELIVRPGNFADMKTVFDICPRDSVQFKPTGGIAYEWHPGIYLDDSFAMAPIVKAITSQQYRMIATSLYGCKDTFSVRVNVHPAAVLILGNTATIYPGQSYHITPQTNCTHFAWTPATGLDNAYVSDPIAKPEVNTRYIVHAANEWGCKVTDSIDIQVEPGTLLDLPNAFTPGSGSNSKFFVIKNGIADLKYFRIFNRWGNKVFETTSIDQGWDGTFNGVPQPFGVYVYEIGAVTSQGKNFEKHGNVTLIR